MRSQTTSGASGWPDERLHGGSETRSIPSIAWNPPPDENIIRDICVQIAGELLPTLKHNSIEISPLGSGAFNEVFLVELRLMPSDDEQEAGQPDIARWICRVALPVNPFFKTMSEYATLAWLERNTGVPVPKVLAVSPFDDRERNPLAAEWMIQDHIPGRTLAAAWDHLNYKSRKYVVRQVAEYLAELFRRRHTGIGSIQTNHRPWLGEGENNHAFSIGKMETIRFFWQNRYNAKGIQHGPFSCSREWLETHLAVAKHQCGLYSGDISIGDHNNPSSTSSVAEPLCVSTSEISNDGSPEDVRVTGEACEDKSSETDEEDSTTLDEVVAVHDRRNTDRLASYEMIERLSRLLPQFIEEIPSSSVEQTVLYHHDMSMLNILVNEEGTISGIIDWENTACLPAWAACEIPDFLNQGECGVALFDTSNCNRDMLSYHDRLMSTQLKRLREKFLEYMSQICPRWVETYEEGRPQRDYYRAIESCENRRLRGKLNEWLDLFERNGCSLSREVYAPFEC